MSPLQYSQARSEACWSQAAEEAAQLQQEAATLEAREAALATERADVDRRLQQLQVRPWRTCVETHSWWSKAK